MESRWISVIRARSLLFVPGHRPDRFDKAATSGADSVVLDLEDAVGTELKSSAREHVRKWLESGHDGIVRINHVGSPHYEEDMAAIADMECVVMLPKIQHRDDVREVVSRLRDGSAVIPLLETAPSILDAGEICKTPGVIRATFGNGDLGRELGIDSGDLGALTYARSAVVIASSAAEIASPVDGGTTKLHDEQKLLADTKHGASMGFTGKACIHPSQVNIVNSVHTPSDEMVRWAREVLAAEGDGSVGVLDGQVIGRPIFDRAKRILERAEH